MSTSDEKPNKEIGTVQELADGLAELIRTGHGDNKVVIPYRRSGAIGGTPSTGIKQIYAGFDWDHGRVFLGPEKSLGIHQAEIEKSLEKADSILYKILRALDDDRVDPEKRIANAKAHLDAWRARPAPIPAIDESTDSQPDTPAVKPGRPTR